MSEKELVKPICAVDYAFGRIGGKYKGRLLWYLYMHKILRYGELKRHITNITTKMLTQTLRELEKDGLIDRKVEYSLTEVGSELIPFISYLREWGAKQMEKENIPATFSSAGHDKI